MKRRGSHPEKALTAIRAKNLAVPGRHADGNGLYLVIDPSGAKRWVLRTVVGRRRRDIGLGSFRLVGLAEAREKAQAYRKLARAGGDPLVELRKARRSVPTFAEAAEAVHAEHKEAWRNAKHRQQWINTLRHYVIPNIGNRRVDQIDSPEVLKVLGPIWLTKPETARRVKQRIGTVLDWSKASGFRDGDNPIDGVAKGLPKQPDRKNHFKALAYADVPGFMQRLREPGPEDVVALAFEFLILTAARTGEVIGAKWAEIDFHGTVWTISADRMKAKREHRIPLSARCVEILKQVRTLDADSAYVFPGRSYGRPLSNMAFLMTLRRLNCHVTAHGFRSAFSDWAAERTNFPREVCEMALAHTIKNKAEAAYRRGDLFEKRRKLMEAWAAFVTAARGVVVNLRADSN